MVLTLSSIKPKVFADDRGVWREDKPNQPFGFLWDEIVSVGGYKLDGITEVFTVLELDHPSGHFMELHHDWPGFAGVVEAITQHLPGIDHDWFSRIESLSPRSDAVKVWQRA